MVSPKRWVLMLSDDIGPARPSAHNDTGRTTLQMVTAVVGGHDGVRSTFSHLKPLQRDVLLARAAADPGSFRVTGQNANQGTVTYWFELREG